MKARLVLGSIALLLSPASAYGAPPTKVSVELSGAPAGPARSPSNLGSTALASVLNKVVVPAGLARAATAAPPAVAGTAGSPTHVINCVGDDVNIVGGDPHGAGGAGGGTPIVGCRGSDQELDTNWWAFDASSPDGIMSVGRRWQVTVVHNGQTTIYAPPLTCAPVGAIQPGDHVDVQALIGSAVSVNYKRGCR